MNGIATFVTTTDPIRAAAEHSKKIIGLIFIENGCESSGLRLQAQSGILLLGPLERPPFSSRIPGNDHSVTGRCPSNRLLARYLLSYLQLVSTARIYSSYLQRSFLLGSLTLANLEGSHKIFRTQKPGHGPHHRRLRYGKVPFRTAKVRRHRDAWPLSASPFLEREVTPQLFGKVEVRKPARINALSVRDRAVIGRKRLHLMCLLGPEKIGPSARSHLSLSPSWASGCMDSSVLFPHSAVAKVGFDILALGVFELSAESSDR